jgi:hypothetical protein
MRRSNLKMSGSVDGLVGGPEGGIDWVFPTMDEAKPDWAGFTTKTQRHQDRLSGPCAFCALLRPKKAFVSGSGGAGADEWRPSLRQGYGWQARWAWSEPGLRIS